LAWFAAMTAGSLDSALDQSFRIDVDCVTRAVLVGLWINVKQRQIVGLSAAGARPLARPSLHFGFVYSSSARHRHDAVGVDDSASSAVVQHTDSLMLGRRGAMRSLHEN
jgi:hypothetical protein